MHTEVQTHSRVNQRGWWWVSPAVGILVGLCGCTAPATTRRAVAPPAAIAAPATYILKDIRPSSTPETTHVVITVSGPVQPLVQRLAQPDRLAIDLPETQLPQQWSQQEVLVADGRLQTIQVTQSQ